MVFAENETLQEAPLHKHKITPSWQAPKRLQKQQQYLHCKFCGARITFEFAKF